MSRNATSPPRDNGRIAVVDFAGDAWIVLVAETDGTTPTIVEARRFGASDTAAVRRELEDQRVGRVIRVLPAGACVCRTTLMPSGDDEQLHEALELQSEALELGGAPAHRRGTGVLDTAVGESNRTGVIVAWPERVEPRELELDLPVTFAPEVGALAALIGSARPADALISVDRGSGSVGLVLTHANGVLIRATHEDTTSADWLTQLGRTTTETALSVNHTLPFAQGLLERSRPTLEALGDSGAALILPDEVIEEVGRRVNGIPADAAWMHQYGVAVGGLLAATGPLHGLCSMLAEPREEHPPFHERAAARLSQPAFAIRVAVAALIVLGLCPLLMAGLRLKVLELRHDEIGAQRRQVDSKEAQLVMLQAMGDKTWSMTKILSDLVTCVPQGVELSTIRVDANGGKVTFTGKAVAANGQTPTQVLNEMERNLGDMSVFTSDGLDSDPVKLGYHEFTASANVNHPHFRPRYPVELDYARWTLQERTYGVPKPEDEKPAPAGDDDDANASTEPAPAAGNDEGSPPAGANQDSTTTDAGRDNETDSGTSAGGRSGHAGPGIGNSGAGSSLRDAQTGEGDVDIPEPLTIEQIEVMSEPDLRLRLSTVAEARTLLRKLGRSDEEIADQLLDETKLIMKRLRELKDSQ